ncbi:MAG: hypothetical protein ACRELF_22570, partial [Gemmataceae bacterium]
MNTATIQRPATAVEYATITAQYLNEKKPNQRNASIKDVDGVYYWVKPEELRNFQAGATYDISFVATESNGYTNRTIKSFEPVQRQAPAPRPQATRQASQQPQRTATVQHQEQQPPRNTNMDWNRPTHPRDGQRMFVCSILNAFIQTGRVENDVAALTDAVVK